MAKTLEGPYAEQIMNIRQRLCGVEKQVRATVLGVVRERFPDEDPKKVVVDHADVFKDTLDESCLMRRAQLTMELTIALGMRRIYLRRVRRTKRDHSIVVAPATA
jgi:hypothetical protein